MRKITIPLTKNNCQFLRLIHPFDFKATKKDPLALSIEAVIKTNSYSLKDLTETINRKKYCEEIEVIYTNNRYRRAAGSKISMYMVKEINYMIDRMIKIEFLKYAKERRKKCPDIMYKDCIVYFCEDYCLDYDLTLCETLKKLEYRDRIKTNK
jgi:hypothetical protein